MCQGPEAISVGVQPEDTVFEREKSARAEALDGFFRCLFGQLGVLPQNRRGDAGLRAFLKSGPAVCADGEAYLFTVSADAGKTARARQWLSRIPGACVKLYRLQWSMNPEAALTASHRMREA